MKDPGRKGIGTVLNRPCVCVSARVRFVPGGGDGSFVCWRPLDPTCLRPGRQKDRQSQPTTLWQSIRPASLIFTCLCPPLASGFRLYTVGVSLTVSTALARRALTKYPQSNWPFCSISRRLARRLIRLGPLPASPSGRLTASVSTWLGPWRPSDRTTPRWGVFLPAAEGRILGKILTTSIGGVWGEWMLWMFVDSWDDLASQRCDERFHFIRDVMLAQTTHSTNPSSCTTAGGRQPGQ
jgi:hypothetical protein